MLTINFKRGDTFRLQGTYKEDGAATALPNGVKAQLRDGNDTLVAQLSVERVDEGGGKYELSFGSTAAWVPGRTLYGDVEFTDAVGTVLSTETYVVNVRADVTHD